MPNRPTALLLLLALGSPCTALAQGAPTIVTTDSARSLTLKPDFPPVRDGEGNVVGTISGMTITVVEAQGSKTHYSIDYGFYNGSGTWRGSQTVNVQFKNKDGGTLTQVSFPLDRSHCVYGKVEARHVEGAMENIITLIDHVDVAVTPVSGVQTRC